MAASSVLSHSRRLGAIEDNHQKKHKKTILGAIEDDSRRQRDVTTTKINTRKQATQKQTRERARPPVRSQAGVVVIVTSRSRRYRLLGVKVTGRSPPLPLPLTTVTDTTRAVRTTTRATRNKKQTTTTFFLFGVKLVDTRTRRTRLCKRFIF